MKIWASATKRPTWRTACCRTTARSKITSSVWREFPLLFSPGTRWEYGLSIDVLGRLVEVVSGMPLDQFFRTRIFEPLGMRDTYFFPPENKLDRLAVAYTYYPEKGLQRFPDTPITEGPRVIRLIIRIAVRRNFFRVAVV